MKDTHLDELLAEERYDELENYWLESMESGRFHLTDFLDVARMLGRSRHKDRAGVLMGLLDEYLAEHELRGPRLKVLREIGHHLPNLRKLDDLREQMRDALLKLYPGRPSTAAIFRHYTFDDISTSGQLAKAAEEIEEWLKHDVGEVFYREGYGTGVITEINLKLRVMRLNFDGKETTFQLGDQELVALPPGHILREKHQTPEQFRQRALQEPAGVLGELLQSLGRPMTVGEIKMCLSPAIPHEQWSRWWTAARKNQQVLTAGKGAQAVYSWSDSAAAAEQAVREEFDAADVPKRISIARANLRRSPELEQHFRAILLRDAGQSFQSEKWDLALDVLDLFSRWPGAASQLPFTIADIVHAADPATLLASLDNAVLKEKVLNEIKRANPETWPETFAALVVKEEHPRILSLMMGALWEADSETARVLMERFAANPTVYPAAFTWIAESAAQPEGTEGERLPKVDDRFFLLVMKAVEAPEFSHYRTRLKKAIEGGLLVTAFAGEVEADVAHKTLELLEKSDHIEEYRRERWRNAIRARVPQTRPAEEWIFSTKEAYDRKRVELDQLITVELPKNRKAVGEAAAHGDLSENHEYKAAREQQDYLINRVAMLQQDLKRVRVLEPGHIDCSQVRPGTRVVLSQTSEKRMTMTILGPWDSNPTEGIYSYQAPVGMILLGKLPGEKVQWNQEEWTVERIEPWSS